MKIELTAKGKAEIKRRGLDNYEAQKYFKDILHPTFKEIKNALKDNGI
jgi:hypothetical protein